MKTFHIYEIDLIFSDGSHRSMSVNCSNSVEAIKAGCSSPGVAEKVQGAGVAKAEIVTVLCNLSSFRA